MKKHTIICMLLLCLTASVAVAQQPDTIVIKLDSTFSYSVLVSQVGDDFWLFEGSKKIIYKLNSVVQPTLIFDSQKLENQTAIWCPIYFGESILMLDYATDKLIEFTPDYNFSKKVNILFPFKYRNYSLSSLNFLRSNNFDKPNLNFIPVQRRYKLVPNLDNTERTNKYYRESQLLARLNSKGKVVSIFGSYDDVYQKFKFLPYLDGYYYTVDSTTNHVYLGLQASPVIQVFDLNGNPVGSFGKYVKGYEDFPFKRINSRKEYLEKFDTYTIESIEYSRVLMTESFIIREVYLPAIDIYEPIILQDENSCWNDPYSIERFLLTHQKELLIQIYNSTNREFIREMNLGKAVRILSISDDHITFYTESYNIDTKDNTLKIIRFKDIDLNKIHP